MDIPSVRHPSWHDASIGDASTHGLTPTCTETVGGQIHNNPNNINIIVSFLQERQT